jgi:hypothetical protein
MTAKRILVILATLGILAGGTAAATATTHAAASAPQSFYHA